MSTPDLKIEIAFGDPPLTSNAAATWTDVSAYQKTTDANGRATIVQSITRGRRNELSDVEAGTAVVILKNADRRFDPTDSTGPHFGDILPMVKIRLSAIWDSTTYPLFNGYVERWDVDYEGGNISTATLSCVDAFKIFNLLDIVATARAQEDTGTRIEAVLAAVGWDTGDQVIALGDLEVAEMDLDASALAIIQQCVDVERGLFFIDNAGYATFQSRSWRNTLLSSGMWGNEADGSELPYADFTTRFDDSNIWNQIKVTRAGGIEQVAADGTSVTAYVARTMKSTGLPFVDDDDALEAAQWALAQFKEPRVRPDLMVIDPSVRDSWPDVLVRELSDVISIDHRTIVDGDLASFDAFIEGISWKIRKGAWRVTWQLSPRFIVTPDAGTLSTTDTWIAPTLINSWADYGGSETVAGYRKEGEWVYLRGSIEGGTSGSVALVLPTEHRPAERQRWQTTSNGTYGGGNVRVDTNGEVRVSDAGTAPGDPVTGGLYVALNGQFRVI